MESQTDTASSQKLSRSAKFSLLISALCTLILAPSTPFLNTSRLENIGQDMLTRIARQQTRLPDQVKVILIDEDSLQYMESKVGRWPWPRRVYKDIIEFINLGAARAIHFDILFSERSSQQAEENDDDTVLAQASAEAGNVIHAMQLLSDDNNAQPRVALPAIVAENASDSSADLENPYRDFLAPFDPLLKASMGIGIVNAKVDEDGVYRSTRAFYRYGDKTLPALSIAGAIKTKDSRLSQRWTALASDPDRQLVNFYAEVPAYSLSGIIESARQIQRGDSEALLVNPEEFADSYVFIGASAIGLHDLKATPMSTLSPGVYVHASYLANLLNGDLLQAVDSRWVYVLIPLLSFVIAWLILRARHLTLQLLAPSLMALFYFVFAFYLRQHNLQLALTTPFLSIVVSGVGVYAYLFAVEERERKRVRAMFSRYVSPAALTVLLNQMESARTAASGSREFISVLFCDLRGFTTLSENLPAEEIVRILNHYFSIMTDIIFHHGGTVDKFIGDAIMATWGAPLPSQSHALDAVCCALSMQAAVPDINHWLQQQGLPAINIGIGVHSGEAIMGSLGSQQKADFTVIGDTVNIASRLEGVTKIYQRTVVISEDTWHAVRQKVDCQLLDYIKVKGKQQAGRIYSPLGETGNAGAGDNSIDHKRIMLESERAFDLYSQQKWQACQALLEKLPDKAKLDHLAQRCHEYQQQAPSPDWQPIYTLLSK